MDKNIFSYILNVWWKVYKIISFTWVPKWSAYFDIRWFICFVMIKLGNFSLPINISVLVPSNKQVLVLSLSRLFSNCRLDGYWTAKQFSVFWRLASTRSRPQYQLKACFLWSDLHYFFSHGRCLMKVLDFSVKSPWWCFPSSEYFPVVSASQTQRWAWDVTWYFK